MHNSRINLKAWFKLHHCHHLTIQNHATISKTPQIQNRNPKIFLDTNCYLEGPDIFYWCDKTKLNSRNGCLNSQVEAEEKRVGKTEELALLVMRPRLWLSSPGHPQAGWGFLSPWWAEHGDACNTTALHVQCS